MLSDDEELERNLKQILGTHEEPKEINDEDNEQTET